MATDTIDRPMTADEFVERAESAPPDITLELIEGELRERPAMLCGPPQGVAIARIGHALANWLDNRTDGVGVVAAGETRCRIAADPDTVIGIDLVYFEGRAPFDRAANEKFFDGTPLLAVEVLSSSDVRESVDQRIRLLLGAGVTQIWIVNPEFQTITVHRPEVEPVMFSARQEIDGGSDLPGFRARVATLFTGTRRST